MVWDVTEWKDMGVSRWCGVVLSRMYSKRYFGLGPNGVENMKCCSGANMLRVHLLYVIVFNNRRTIRSERTGL